MPNINNWKGKKWGKKFIFFLNTEHKGEKKKIENQIDTQNSWWSYLYKTVLLQYLPSRSSWRIHEQHLWTNFGCSEKLL